MLILLILNFVFCAYFVFLMRSKPFFFIFPVYGRILPAIQSKKCADPVHIVHQVTQADLHKGSGNTCSPQNQSAGLLRLNTENMFHSASYSGSGFVSFLLNPAQLAATVSLALNMFSISALMQTVQALLRSVRRICPHILARIVGQKFFKNIAVVQGGIGHRKTANQLVLHIYRHMIQIGRASCRERV